MTRVLLTPSRAGLRAGPFSQEFRTIGLGRSPKFFSNLRHGRTHFVGPGEGSMRGRIPRPERLLEWERRLRRLCQLAGWAVGVFLVAAAVAVVW